MNKNQIMMSAAMLEAMWEVRRKDMLDLITPFIMYAVAVTTSPEEEINLNLVQSNVQKNYGYTDIPISIIEKVLKRNTYQAVRKENHKFILIKDIDLEFSQMEKRKEECESYLSILGISLAKYLNEHCKKANNFKEENTIQYLHNFFSRYGLQVGIDSLVRAKISVKDYEIDYYIAKYIFECKDNGKKEYKYLMDLIKGYFLRLAIYVQPENGDINKSRYSNVIFFYDTPFLINLLGYSGEEKANSANLLHNMLKKQKGKFRFFSHTKDEVQNILVAYKYSLIPNRKNVGFRTLDGLNKLNFKPSDVDREIQFLNTKLRNNFGIEEYETPPYFVNNEGFVDERQVVGEEEIKEYIRSNIEHYTDTNLENDVRSALAIHRLRGDSHCEKIEKCKYIFVTNNKDFTDLFNKYYRENINARVFAPLITDTYLSAITWVKCGEVNELPERELLKNAYMALQPVPEIINKIEEILQKLETFGDLSPEEIVALRASRVFKNELWEKSFGNVEEITEVSVRDAVKKQRETLIIDEKLKHKAELNSLKINYNKNLEEITKDKQEIIQEFNKKISDISIQQQMDKEQKDREQAEKNRKSADKYAKKKRAQLITGVICIINIVSILLICYGIWNTVFAIKYDNNFWRSIIMAFFAVISIYDTIIAKKYYIMRILNKFANQYETKIYEEKLNEYNKLMK